MNINEATTDAVREATTDAVRALVCRSLGPDLQGVAVGGVALNAPGPQEVHIRVRSAALNFPDLLMTEGRYQYKPDLPFVLGTEGAGEVLACGRDVAQFKQGDRVSFSVRCGAIAEQVVVDAAHVTGSPQEFNDDQAAAYHVGAITAYVALVVRGNLQPGETLLVHGASGGMGFAAVQLGVHLGANVIATGTSDTKLGVVTAAGAHHVLNLKNGFREQVKTLTAGEGADVIYDPVGGDVFDESVRCIRWGGRLLVIGFAGGRIASIAANMPLIKGFSVVGVRAGEEVRHQPVLGPTYLRKVLALANAGVFKPHIGAVFTLDQSLEALKSLSRRQFAGKVVIRP